MSSGYGSRIYVNKNKRSSTKYILVFLSLIALLLIIFLFSKNSGETPSNKNIAHKKNSHTLVEKENSVKKDEIYLKSDKNENIEDENRNIEEKYSTNSVLNENNRKNSNGNNENIGNRLFAEGKFREAIGFYNSALKSNMSLIARIGLCYFRLSEYDKAVKFLLKSKEAGYYPFLTRKFLAFSFYQLNQLNTCLENVEEALEIRKDSELEMFKMKLKKEKSVMSDYKDQSSGRFLIQFSRIEHSEIRDIVLDYLKTAYREIGKELDIYPEKKVVVILYNGRNFFDVTRAPGWAGGLFDGKIRIPIAGADNDLKLLKRVLFHEYTHVLVSLVTTKCPLWLNEGLAEYFSEEDLKKSGQIIPLRMLEKHFPSGNKTAVAIAYLESYSAVSYIVDKYGIYKIKNLLEELNTTNINNAFETVFYISYDDFLEKWGNTSD